jgi:serine/threonine protein kinase
MLYQLAHGYLPWKSNGSDKNMFKAEIQTIVFTYDSSWLSVDCIKFISRCLDKDPNTRIGIK